MFIVIWILDLIKILRIELFIFANEFMALVIQQQAVPVTW